MKKSKKTRTGEEKPEMADEEPEWVDANERCGSDNVATETLADPGVAATSLEQVEHRMKHQVKEIVEKELRRSRTMSDHAGLIEGRVRAARVLWTDELLRHCSTMPRPRKSDDAPYAHVLTGGCVTHRFKIDYELFGYVLKDIEEKVDPYGSVMVTPSGDYMIGRSAKMTTDIIFNKASTFFDWLGITKDMDRMGILVEDRNQPGSGGTQSVRIMGALRQNLADADACIQLLVGRSASNITTSKIHERDPAVTAMDERDDAWGDGAVDCIAYATGHWDDENCEMAEPATVARGNTGPLVMESIDSTFSISWKALAPLCRRKYSVTPHFTEGVQMGYVTVRYPYILVRGRTACNQVRTALQGLPLEKLL